MKYRISALVALKQLLDAIKTGNHDDVLLLFASDPTATEAINQYNDDLHDVNFGELSSEQKVDEKYLEFIDKLAERSMKFKQEKLKLPDNHYHPTTMPETETLLLLLKRVEEWLLLYDLQAAV